MIATSNASRVRASPWICAIGDTHGHLQLALGMAAQWQQRLGISFDAVLLCGDVGTFTHDAQLDSATRSHARSNPCELEFLLQWAVRPQPPWIGRIFAPMDQGGLGLDAPVVMVHGNHEGFDHLADLVPRDTPPEPVPFAELPAVDSAGWIRYLPSGWRGLTQSGLSVGGVGGIERDQRRSRYHELAYLDDEAIFRLLEAESLDVLLTHQGPETVQGKHGSATLDLLLEADLADLWFHGHATPTMEIARWGPFEGTTVIPLESVAFSLEGPCRGDPGGNAWCRVGYEDAMRIERTCPDFWRDYRMSNWEELPNGQLIAPPLAQDSS